jgi:hypothetical protein
LLHYIDILCKKLEYPIKPKNFKDKIRPPLVFFFLKCKKTTAMTKSSANFLSPEPNEQGCCNYIDLFHTYKLSIV